MTTLLPRQSALGHPHLWPEEARWLVSGALVVSLYVVAASTLAPRPQFASADAGSPVVMVDLAPMPAAPDASNLDLAPGILQPQAQSEAHERETAQPEPTPAPIPLPELAENHQAAVQLEAARPKPEQTQATRAVEQEAAPDAPLPTAPPKTLTMAALAAGPALGTDPQRPSQAVLTWQRRLVVKLQQGKRYPARARGEKGTARVSFAIDRTGRVVSASLSQCSGSAALDEEAVALVHRAAPLPKPPGDVADSQLSFSFPIEFSSAR